MFPPAVRLRPIPYPYLAMLAICSDLDETPDRFVYLDTLRLLNTTRTTPMGPGLGLEVAHSIYFDMPSDQFAYWNTDQRGRAMVRDLIRSGHVDCLHSFGDLAATRDRAAAALDELCRHDCRLEVWVDHATAPTNFGEDIMRGHGDQPGHPAYHADLAIGYGIRYLWRGRVTSVIGQDVPPSPGGLFEPRRPLASARTLAAEAAKHLLARCGHRRYAMHGPNRLLRPVTLRDGREACEFLRCSPHWGGVSSCDTARGIGQVLTDRMLRHLARCGGVCALYTHLGKVLRYDRPFGPDAIAGLQRLAEAHRSGRVLVTTTRRLLRYCRAREQLRFRVLGRRDGLHIDVQCAMPGFCADGLTFYVPVEAPATIAVNGVAAPVVRANPPDRTGSPSVSLPWPRLEMPDL